ncbi:MAG: hypothetical protein ACNA76_05965 [Anaerosomatales bacterium]|nr:hypothetical protein [Coriobacteriia bacterium]
MTTRHARRTTYLEMLEILGGSAADGPPPDDYERFQAAMGTRRNPRNGAPMPYTQEERESLLRRVLAEYLTRHPEMAASARGQSCARLKVRFPRTLYSEIGAAAQADGSSMNTFVVAACAAYLGRREVSGSRLLDPGSSSEDPLAAFDWSER